MPALSGLHFSGLEFRGLQYSRIVFSKIENCVPSSTIKCVTTNTFVSLYIHNRS